MNNPSTYVCSKCHSMLGKYSLSTNVIICNQCNTKNYTSGAAQKNEIEAPFIIAAPFKINAPFQHENFTDTILGIHQVYFHNGYSNFGYFETKFNTFRIIEESYGSYFRYEIMSENLEKLLLRNIKAGNAYALGKNKRMICTAIRKIIFSSSIGEYFEYVDFNKKGFVIEGFEESQLRERYKLIVLTDKSIVGFKGSLIEEKK